VRSPTVKASAGGGGPTVGGGKEVRRGSGKEVRPQATSGRGRWAAEKEGGAVSRQRKEEPHIMRRKVTEVVTCSG
jgi:hypothetical protein